MIRLVGVLEIRAAPDQDRPHVHPIFSAVVAAGRTYTYSDGLTSDQARALWLERPPGRAVVAVEDGTVLGTAMGPNRPGRGSQGATAGFMVDPGYEGRGVRRALGEHVVEWARTAGYRSIRFNAVVETNTGAVRLWRSLGFEVLATAPEAFDHPEHGLVGLHAKYRRV
ncbi:MAG TPA: GNAT family N-acetyltransferase [Pseudonocardia sp.]|nr:GNAT family N-acetyltransferase [Pseudonocardia sp.]